MHTLLIHFILYVDMNGVMYRQCSERTCVHWVHATHFLHILFIVHFKRLCFIIFSDIYIKRFKFLSSLPFAKKKVVIKSYLAYIIHINYKHRIREQ